MLAQNFKSAEELHISNEQLEALIKVLVLMETGKMFHAHKTDFFTDYRLAKKFTGHFNMNTWCKSIGDCGTVACIGGTAQLISGVSFGRVRSDMAQLGALLYPYELEGCCNWAKITVQQAARALRNYLTYGEPRWKEAIEG